MNLVELETLFRLLNQYGISTFESNDIKVSIPSPTKSFADRIMTVTDQEIEAIEQKRIEIKADQLMERQKSQEEITDDLLFFHENY